MLSHYSTIPPLQYSNTPVLHSATPPSPALPSARPPLRDILLVYVVCCVLLIGIGSVLQERDLVSGLLVTELLLILWPPLLYVWRKGYALRPSFHLAPTRLTNGLLSVLSTLALFVLVGGIAQFQEYILPQSELYQRVWTDTLRELHQFPLAVTLLLMAVLPGVCEELFFRGFLLWGFRGSCSDRAAVAWVAVLFGLFHFDPYRLLAVSILGMLFGYLVIVTRSIVPAILAHVTNNAIAVIASYLVLKSGNGELETLAGPDTPSFWQIARVWLPVMIWAALGLAGMLGILRYVNRPARAASSVVKREASAGMDQGDAEHEDASY